MAFTDEERREWHEAKRLREQEKPRSRPQPVATCIHCGQPFGLSEGYVGDGFSICDVCDDD